MKAYPQSIPNRRVFKTFLLYVPIAWVCVASFQYRIFTDYSTFHGDESTWLASTKALSLVLSRDFDNPFWQSYLGRTQPHAGHYAYGLVLRGAGFAIDPQTLPDRYDWRHDQTWNALHHRLPSREVLMTARRFSALCGALACLLLCEMARRTFGWIAGLVAAGWLAGNPLMRFVCQRAMIDGQLTLALVAGVLGLLWLYQRWQIGRPKSILLACVPVGLVCGLAASLKINGGVLCVIAGGAFGGFVLQVLLRKNVASPPIPSRFKAILVPFMSVLILCGIALTTFYTLNPQFWPEGLIQGAADTIALRNTDIQNQQQSHPESALTSVSQSVQTGLNNYFQKWPTSRMRPIQDFKDPFAAGDVPTGLWYIEAPLFCIGIIGLLATIVSRWRRERVVDPACVLLVWFVVYSAFVFFWVPLDWPRYYQKYLPIQALLVGIAVHVMIRPLIAWAVRRPSEGMDQPAQTPP